MKLVWTVGGASTGTVESIFYAILGNGIIQKIYMHKSVNKEHVEPCQWFAWENIFMHIRALYARIAWAWVAWVWQFNALQLPSNHRRIVASWSNFQNFHVIRSTWTRPFCRPKARTANKKTKRGFRIIKSPTKISAAFAEVVNRKDDWIASNSPGPRPFLVHCRFGPFIPDPIAIYDWTHFQDIQRVREGGISLSSGRFCVVLTFECCEELVLSSSSTHH